MHGAVSGLVRTEARRRGRGEEQSETADGAQRDRRSLRPEYCTNHPACPPWDRSRERPSPCGSHGALPRVRAGRAARSRGLFDGLDHGGIVPAARRRLEAGASRVDASSARRRPYALISILPLSLILAVVFSMVWPERFEGSAADGGFALEVLFAEFAGFFTEHAVEFHFGLSGHHVDPGRRQHTRDAASGSDQPPACATSYSSQMPPGPDSDTRPSDTSPSGWFPAARAVFAVADQS